MSHQVFRTKVIFAIFLLLVEPGVAASLTVAELKKTLRDVSTQKTNCKKENCENLKLLTQYEKVLKSAVETQTKLDLILEENQTLKNQAETLTSKLTLDKKGGCDKPHLLDEKMVELGINENGNLIYDKRPAGMDGAQCWSNSKKKKSATVTLCQFPLAITILTVGGDSQYPTERKQEYIFDLNGCNLVSVKILEERKNKKKAKILAIPACLQEWNKRTADATMTKARVKEMEDTIAQCFKYNLLPISEARLKTMNSNTPDQKNITEKIK